LKDLLARLLSLDLDGVEGEGGIFL